jgi:hypothetical protein
MKTTKPTGAIMSRGIVFAALLAALLAVLFGKSFLPGYVHFSNDGPLGANSVKYLTLPAAFTGTWIDLSSIGGNGGAYPMGVTALFHMILGPVGCAKFLPPIMLFILGLGAWTFFRQLQLSPLAAILGALATVLNSTFFSNTCWGVGSQYIALGMDFFALALVVSTTSETPALVRWLRLALAGMAVGINVIEAADIGAIFSLFVAAFVLCKNLVDEGSPVLVKLGRGVGSVAIIAVFAGFMAMQTVVSLVGSQISGVAGTAQDTESKARHWNWATQWSEPKVETLGLLVPGLFGYRMNTPADMMAFLQDAYQGGNYWGGVGRDPALDAYLDNGRVGPAPQGFMRFTGGQNYCGILVVLVALWAVVQSWRRQNSVFPEAERRLIWFLTAVLVGSLLLAWGRFAPFYALLYKLPYASNMRNPTKFLILFSWVIVILFAYGVHALSRCYMDASAANSTTLLAQLKNWWAKVRGFDRNWTWGCLAVFLGALVAWLIYAMRKQALVDHLQNVGFGEAMAGDIAAFSIGQAGWFILLCALAIGLCLLALAGGFAGKRAWLGGLLLGAFLVADLGRADLPYIIHWDYKQKYASNPILDFLRHEPNQYRVTTLPFNAPPQFSLFHDLYTIEWVQHQFLYYNIQTLDVVQMPRIPADLEAFERALAFRGTPDSVPLIARRWQLTNVRYLLGPAGFFDVLNEQLDPAQHRFRIVQRFNVVAKPGIERPTQLEELTAVTNNSGQYALFEYSGALPRVKLYSRWQISTNDTDTLQTLASTNFNAAQTVLVASPLPVTPAPDAADTNSGTVEFKSYAPTDIVFATRADRATVLLLNDKFDPNWRVLVDGKPAGLLRCNFIMRGVLVPAGPHTVEFKFTLPHGPLYVTLTAMGIGVLLCGCLFVATRRRPESPA